MSTKSRVRIRMPEHFRADRRQSEAPDPKRDVHTFYGLPKCQTSASLGFWARTWTTCWPRI